MVETPGSHEQERALQIYATLREYAHHPHDGFVSLGGFYKGEVYYPSQNMYTTISHIQAHLQTEFEWLAAEGFTEKEARRGVWSIVSRQAEYSHGMASPRKLGNKLHHLHVATIDRLKVIEPDPQSPHTGRPTELGDEGRWAIRAVNELSSIPFDILDTFGSFPRFADLTRKPLTPPDLDRIDSCDTKGFILYNGGLRMYVDRLRRLKEGKPGDSSYIMITEMLDPRDHFGQVRRMLDGVKSDGTSRLEGETL